MITAKVVGIYISSRRGEATQEVEQIHVIPGKGIEGDRYFQIPGKPDAITRTGREITLIEMEAIEAMSQQDGIQISPGQTRRNLITRGVSLNGLIGKLFTIGKIQLIGIRLCEPCEYLAGRTNPRILQSMAHRGGLRADIISEGTIHVDDPIII